MMRRRKFCIVTVLFIAMLLLGGCGSIDDTQSNVQLTQYGQFFPVVKDEPIYEPNPGWIQGALIRDDNGYLRVANQLIIWPYGYSCLKEGDTFWILDADGEKCCKPGDSIRVYGPNVYYDFTVGLVGTELPDDCLGPYLWAIAVTNTN